MRNQQKFEGIIITDDLGMLSRGKGRNAENDLRKALVSGADIILYVIPSVNRERALQIAREVYDSGALSEAELNARIARILRIKSQL